MSDSNPLQQYFRQPKIFISLPSKGLYYGAGSFQGDYNSVPIMAMTGMDEILMKTPDALFNGEATFKVIESCCPFICRQFVDCYQNGNFWKNDLY